MYEYAATVERVVDGDTVDVTFDLGFSISYRDRVRLLGINTPEKIMQKGGTQADKDRGIAATAFAVDWYAAQESIRVQTSLDDKGKFGRVLGRIIGDNDECLNDVLIAEGHAVVYDGGKR